MGGQYDLQAAAEGSTGIMNVVHPFPGPDLTDLGFEVGDAVATGATGLLLKVQPDAEVQRVQVRAMGWSHFLSPEPPGCQLALKVPLSYASCVSGGPFFSSDMLAIAVEDRKRLPSEDLLVGLESEGSINPNGRESSPIASNVVKYHVTSENSRLPGTSSSSFGSGWGVRSHTSLFT